MDLDKRKIKLFTIVIDEYIKTAEPVGSKLLSFKTKTKLSSATIRNEMTELERQGLVYQPHTSAGRIPTEVGWRYYIDNLLKSSELEKAEQNKISKLFKNFEKEGFENNIKLIAREISDLVDGAVVVALAPNNVYYTGITNVFKQPEFCRVDVILNMTNIMDHLDAVMSDIFDNIDHPVILLGKDNPFGMDAGAVLTKYKLGDQEGVLGILGPTRMNYQKNFNIINYLTNSFQNV